ncbi:MAG: OmpH family outer membrane protein [Saprospiraceae bacterium]|jgi:outer membrane protein|nr:OmpH family outer membrane protein [Saprospiraceae bacterium]
MRHTFFILYVLLVISQCQQTAPKPAPVQVSSTGNQSPKIVYVNVDTLIENYDLYKERKAQLEAEGKKAEQNIGGKIQAFQKKIEAFQRKVMETQQRAQDIAPVELKKLESAFAQEQQKLAAEEASLAKQKDEAGLALEKKLGDLQKDLKTKVDDYLERISAERGYDYVLIKSSAGGGVLYGNKGLDITQEAIVTINEEHKKSK